MNYGSMEWNHNSAALRHPMPRPDRGGRLGHTARLERDNVVRDTLAHRSGDPARVMRPPPEKPSMSSRSEPRLVTA